MSSKSSTPVEYKIVVLGGGGTEIPIKAKSSKIYFSKLQKM
jgi:hypothetical protein